VGAGNRIDAEHGGAVRLIATVTTIRVLLLVRRELRNPEAVGAAFR
jgi:hypothetical protein